METLLIITFYNCFTRVTLFCVFRVVTAVFAFLCVPFCHSVVKLETALAFNLEVVRSQPCFKRNVVFKIVYRETNQHQSLRGTGKTDMCCL